MRTPNADRAEVPPQKVTDYLLSGATERARAKAQFFLDKGFERRRWGRLVNALVLHVRAHECFNVVPSRWGTKYVVEGALRCPDGASPRVRSIWIIEPPATHPRLVTAYPIPRAKD